MVISVIVPHYNSYESLKKLALTVPVREEIELIVIDDRSDAGKDGLTAVRKLVESRNGVFLDNTGKKGPGTCRNKGIEHASGEWIIFADADDYFLPGAFPVLLSYAGSDAEIIYFPPTSISLKSGKPSFRHVPYKKLVKHYLKTRSKESALRLRYYFVPPVSKLYRNSLIRDNHITFGTTMISEDVMFSTRAAYAAGKIDVSDKAVYCITSADHTLTTTKNAHRFDDKFEILIEEYHYLKTHLTSAEFQKLRFSARTHLAEALLNYGPGMTLRCLKRLREERIPPNLLAL